MAIAAARYHQRRDACVPSAVAANGAGRRRQTFSSRFSATSPVGRTASVSSRSANTTMSISPGLEKLRRVALDQADEQPGDDGALDVAETADNDDGERLDDHRRAGEGREHQHRAQHRARHAGERGGDHESEHDQLVGIDAHQAGGLAILRHRPQRLAEKREFHERIEQADGRRRDHDDQHALRGEKYPADADDLVAVRGLERVRDRPEPGEHRVLEHDRNADGRDQREQLAAALAQRGKDGGVHQPAERPADRQARPQC